MAATSVICVGETLWDVLPQGEYLGGAPLNVAAHAAHLGLQARLVSRVGNDVRGQRALAALRARSMDVTLIQLDPDLPTGIAATQLDAGGAASYCFPAPCAWDALVATPAALLAAQGATVVFGTLAQRSAGGAAAITKLLSVASWRVLDVNLRAPHAARELALESLGHADFVKLNEHEVCAFAGWLGTAPTAQAVQAALLADFAIRSVCVTEGEHGARLWHEGSYVVQPAYPATVVDTIGAGDAFIAMLLTELLRGASPTAAMNRAARLAAYVVSCAGALPDYDAEHFAR